jgi:NTP pyrophosphatase (non-canonical NTP hydrolase)
MTDGEDSQPQDRTLAQVQGAVDAWMNRFGGEYWHPLANLARLTEELGELAREINHAHGPKKKKASEQDGDIAEELGDILFVVAALANSMQIDLNASFQAVMTKYKVRDAGRWVKPEPPHDEP